MSTPDPVDLRLASAVAEFGRTTVLQIAARAGVHPEEAAVRLLRMGAAGLPLVIGAEGDGAALQGWVQAQQAPPPPMPPPWAPPMNQPPGWEGPQSPDWPHQPQPPRTPPGAPGVATVGDTLSTVSATGEPIAITLVEVVDTADALIAAAGQQLPPGTRASIMHTEVTAGPHGYAAIPDTCLTIVLADGSEVGKSGTALSSRPPFRSGLAPGETAGGHTVFELDAHASIAGVRWRSVPDAPPLEWRTA